VAPRAQIASSAAHIDPRFARSDIPSGATAAGYFMVRGLEGAEEQIRIALGDGALTLPPLRTHRVRLHMQHLSNHTPAHEEFVQVSETTAHSNLSSFSCRFTMTGS
jgi:hypothetical protein